MKINFLDILPVVGVVLSGLGVYDVGKREEDVVTLSLGGLNNLVGLILVGLMYSETVDVDDTIWTRVGRNVGLMLMKVPTSGSMPGASPEGSREVLSAAGLSPRTGMEGRKVGLEIVQQSHFGSRFAFWHFNWQR